MDTLPPPLPLPLSYLAADITPVSLQMSLWAAGGEPTLVAPHGRCIHYPGPNLYTNGPPDLLCLHFPMPGLLSLAHLSPPSRWPLRFVIFLRSFKVADTLRRDGPITITATIRGGRETVCWVEGHIVQEELYVFELRRYFLSLWGFCVLPRLPLHEQLVFTVQPKPYSGASIKGSASDLSPHVAQWAPDIWFHEDKKMNRPLGGFY